MYTVAALRDVHTRCHQSLDGFLTHAASIESDALARELEGFGYPTILQQFHHVVGAEQYWLGVVRGEMLVDEDEADFASVEAVRAFADRTRATTRAWFDATNDDDVNRVRAMTTWGDKQVELAPAHVVLRTQTHLFQHLGQVAAMCRVVGKPIPAGLDFPIR